MENGASADELTLISHGAGSLGAKNGVIYLYTDVLGTYAGGKDGQPLVITFSSMPATWHIERMFAQLAFRTVVNAPSALVRTIKAVFTDAREAASLHMTFTVGVTRINDAPKLNTVLSPTLTASRTQQHRRERPSHEQKWAGRRDNDHWRVVLCFWGPPVRPLASETTAASKA